MKTVEEHIGLKVAELREQRGWNQRELGEVLEKVTGRKWERQSVWAAEHGKRAWAIADLLGIADVFDVSLSDLLLSDDALNVGGVERTPGDLSRMTESDSQFEGHWQSFLALEGLRSILDTATAEYQLALDSVRKKANGSPEFYELIRGYLAKATDVQKDRAAKAAASEEADISTPQKFREYMTSNGYLEAPPIMAALDVLDGREEESEESEDGEGK